MESGLGTLLKSANEKGLEVNPPKTKMVLFKRKYNISDFNLPRLNSRL